MSNNIELGINSAFAFKKWVDPDEWVGIIAKEIGSKNIQASFDLFYPSFKEANYPYLCKKINRALKKYDAKISSTFTGLNAYLQNMLAHPEPMVRKAAIDYYELAIKISAEIGAPVTGGHLLSFTVKDYNDKERRNYLMNSFFESMAYLSQIAYDYNLSSLTWEYMSTPYEPPHTVEEAERLYKQVNSYTMVPVYLTFDLGHTTGFDLEEGDKNKDVYYVLEKIIPMTDIIHVQQRNSTQANYWPFTPEYNKAGIIDPKKIIKMVNDYSDHTIHLIFEFMHGFDECGENIIRDYKYSLEYWLDYL